MNDFVRINIFGLTVKCISNSKKIINLLKKDFSFFCTDSISEIEFSFEIILGPIPNVDFNKNIKIRTSKSCISYKNGDISYHDYYGEALSVYDFKNNSGTIYSINERRLHELTYLLILSRTGKKMDLSGFHKIHAMGICIDDTVLLVSMDMGGGKSTLFLDMLSYPRVKIISDDSPVIDRNGHVHSFPLRVGVNAKEYIPEEMTKECYYFERKEYGLKKLIPIDSFPNDICAFGSKVVLFSGKRTTGGSCIIKPISSPEMLFLLCKNMFIGIGLPMIIEYFIEFSFKDCICLLKIALLRMRAGCRLYLNSKKYKVFLGNDRNINSKTIYQFIKNGA